MVARPTFHIGKKKLASDDGNSSDELKRDKEVLDINQMDDQVVSKSTNDYGKIIVEESKDQPLIEEIKEARTDS